MRILTALSTAAALSLAPVAATAQPVSAPTGPDTYLQLHVGTFLPQHPDVDGFDPGYDLGAIFGARLSRNLSVEAGLEYYRTTLGESALGSRVESALGVLPVMVSLRARMPFKFAEVSALAGAGLHIARLSTDTTPDALPAVTTSETSRSAPIGFHVGAGASFNVWPTTLVGVEVVRTFVNARFGGEDMRIDGLRAAVTLGYRL